MYRKIEGLEHMTNLQVLNLAFNNIEHLPVWMAKKLRSLQTINLHSNKIFSVGTIYLGFSISAFAYI